MKKYLFSMLISIFFAHFSFGQERDTVHRVDLSLISQVNQGNSYITFPTDIGNIEPIWFEGNLIPNFFLRKNKNSRLMGVLIPQIIVRMYQERSMPIRSSSYIPQFALYFLLKEKSNEKKTSVFGKIAHHSNGQDVNFFLENGDINTKSGDFSTNYFEAGIIKTNFNKQLNAYQFFKSSLKVHPQSWSAAELKGIYSTVRWHNAFSIFKLSNTNIDRKQRSANISVKGEVIWQFGDFNNWESTSLKRLNLNFTFYYHPNFLEDIGLFVQYYHGLDYYNMYFNHQLNVLRFGIMTEKIRF